MVGATLARKYDFEKLALLYEHGILADFQMQQGDDGEVGGCLVLPALVAKHVCREVRLMFLVAPLVAVGTATAGFVLANRYDDPPAQVTVALLCATLAVAWSVCRIRRRAAAWHKRSEGSRPAWHLTGVCGGMV